MCQKGRAWIELSRENLAHNVRELQRILPKHTAMMPAIKANAYGHGAALVGKALQDMGISDFCVATVQEGIELRLAGITGQILRYMWASTPVCGVWGNAAMQSKKSAPFGAFPI